MANKKITQLSPATTPTAPDELPIVIDPSGLAVTQKVTAADLITKASGLATNSTVVTDSFGYLNTVANGAAGEVLTADGAGNVSFQVPAGQSVYDYVVEPGDDLAAIINAAPSGSSIFVKAGTYYLSANTTLQSSCYLTGENGWASIIFLNNYTFDVVGVNQITNLYFAINNASETIYVNGNRVTFNACKFEVNVAANQQLFNNPSAYDRLTVSNCEFLFGYSGQSADSYIDQGVATKATFNNNTISVYLDNNVAPAEPTIKLGSYSKFIDNQVTITATGSTRSQFISFNGTGNLVSNNTFTDNASNTGYYVLADYTGKNTITSNKFEVYNSAILLSNVYEDIISDNSFIQTTSVYNYDTIKMGGSSNGVLIADNLFDGYTPNSIAINSYNCNNNNLSIVNNIIKNFTFGIYLTDSTYDFVTIEGNSFYDNGSDNIVGSAAFTVQQLGNYGVRVEQDKTLYRMYNNTASNIDQYAPVMKNWDAGALGISKAYGAYPTDWFGVATEAIAAGDFGWIQVSGLATVGWDAAVPYADGQQIKPDTFTQFGSATTNDYFNGNMYGSYAGGGSGLYLAQAVLFPQPSIVNFTAAPGGGQTLYDAVVAPSGGDYTSLSAALAAASSGDTIFVRSGTYTSGPITLSLDNITIIGENQETAKIDMGANNFDMTGLGIHIENLGFEFTTGQIIVESDDSGLQNCTLITYGDAYMLQVVAGYGGYRQYVKDCTLKSFYTGSMSNGVVSISSNNPLLSGNFFELPARTGSTTRAPLTLSDELTFVNNHVKIISATAGSIGVDIRTSVNGLITNNTFIDGTNNLEKMLYSGNTGGSYTINSNTFRVKYTAAALYGTGTFNDNAVNVNSSDPAVSINDAGSRMIVSGNNILNNSLAGTGIVINNAVDDAVITSNRIKNFATGIEIVTGNSDRTLLVGNSTRGCTTGLTDNGTATINTGNSF